MCVLNLIGFTGNWSINHCPPVFYNLVISCFGQISQSTVLMQIIVLFILCAHRNHFSNFVSYLYREIQPICKGFLLASCPRGTFVFVLFASKKEPQKAVNVEARWQWQKDSTRLDSTCLTMGQLLRQNRAQRP